MTIRWGSMARSATIWRSSSRRSGERLERADDQRDLVLYLPDEVLVVDHLRATATIHHYEFTAAGERTHGLARSTAPAPYNAEVGAEPANDHGAGDYAGSVERARDAFKRGDLFEVVLSQVFAEKSASGPATLFRRLRRANPSPYGALINLGEGEFLIAASPEMYVRVEGRRIETCPISGTIARGADAIGDAAQILTLLNSAKDSAELTMCTDVDRNDKSRICEPGSVRVIGRRQVELYSRLIHTVDHVEGTLREGFDALDGFLSHTWAVTVTGAPKRRAMQFVEDHEKSARRWYGGAIGCMTFDGGMNTGLTLRTIRLKDGVAEVRVGATLLYDSDPVAEDAECRLKGSALFGVIRQVSGNGGPEIQAAARPGHGRPDSAGRSRGQLRPYARQLLPADRRRGDDAAGGSRSRGSGGDAAGPAGAVAGSGAAGGLRRFGDAGSGGGAGGAGVRRLPGLAGDGRAFRRDAWACWTIRCTARPPPCGCWAARCSTGCPGASRSAATTRCSRSGQACRMSWR